MGRYSEACPTWDDEGRFLLYDVPPLQGEGPVWRLERLERDERVAVQRQRAIVHAFMSKWDEKVAWSDLRAWRSINGWTLKTDPQNVYRWGYSRFMGERSPHLDFVTFTEEFFVRPESAVSAERREALDPNFLVACQEFTKARFLERKVLEVDPGWREDDSWFNACPEFERWARTSDVEGIDILIAAATADRPESLYGHLLLHVRYRGASDGFEPVYQFGAVTDTDVGFIEYFSRGLLGGFWSAIEISDFRAVDRRIMQSEQRNLRHYRLNLDRRQIRHVQERLWEAERRVRYPYFFLDDNCASFLYDLIEPALGFELDGRGSFIVSPTDVLDTLAETSNQGRGPLLKKTSEVHFSSRERAQDGSKRRREAVAAFVDGVGGAPEIEQLADEVERAETERRGELYEQLSRAFSEALVAHEGSDGLHRRAIDYFLYSSRVERFVVEVEQARTRTSRLRAVRLEPMTAEEQLDARETLYMFEDLERRAKVASEWNDRAEKKLEAQDPEEWPAGAKAQYAREVTARETYRAALAGLTDIIDQWEPDLDAVGYLDEKESTFQAAEAARDARAVGPSGKNRVVVGGSALQNDGVLMGSGRLRYAFIAEYLGEQRRRGLRPDIQSQAFDLQLAMPFTGDALRNIEADLTLFGFKTIEQPLDPVRDAWDDVFGWGFDGNVRHDGARDLWAELELAGGYLWPIWRADYASSHLVLGVFPAARALFVDAGTQGHLAARAFVMFRMHTGGSYANAVSFELSSSSAFQFPLWDYTWHQKGRLALDMQLGSGNDPYVLRPFVEGGWTNETYVFESEGERFFRARAGVELEL